ncbi:PD-(D/E)XK nuclease family protein [Helicobacter bizzozeronii]|uniref:PD-(D/E)XK nuclease family protein n=1 Tax=Helicobacter bizzozeronii TaxID=56877 RepID=UPI000CEE695F|nr:PD-(D/E)XK nuclease family protein [Helicobacter bizzozeronii]
MSAGNILYVFSSRRACNAFCAQQEDGFLPTVWSVSEFYSQVSYVPHLQKIPEGVRQVLLMGAIQEVQEEGVLEGSENLIVFEKTFLGYLDGSAFVAHFFSELAKFDLDIAQIPSQDTYGDYAYHLEILQRIYDRYTQALQTWGFYDPLLALKPILLPSVLQKFNHIEFYMEGFLNACEKEMLFKINEIVPVILHTACDRYNKDFLDFLHLELQINHTYALDLRALVSGQNPILHSTHTPFNKDKIRIWSFNERMEQIGLALARVQEWLKKGLEPSKLAIITPSPEMNAWLKLLDIKGNLNFARGKEACAIFEPYLKALENFAPDPHNPKPPLEQLQQACQQCLQIYHTIPPKLQSFNEEFRCTYAPIQASLKGYGFKDLLELYMRALKDLRIDDVGGGKVKVLDVLETRGLRFDHVVLLDFNDHLVPHIKDHDLFLNTPTRQRLKIPTLQDKLNLKKHYYYQLLQNSTQVDIAYSQANNGTYSKMILELQLLNRHQNKNSPPPFKLFPTPRTRHYQEEKITTTIPVGFTWSATKLNDWSACKRRFYLKYIKNYAPTPTEGFNMGTFFHEILYQHYSTHPATPITQAHMQNYLQQRLENLSPLEHLNVKLGLEKMGAFFAEEQERLASGKVLACEKKFSFSWHGVLINGRIDRIDQGVDGSYAILDYKFKSKVSVDKDLDSPKGLDYQLLIYQLAAPSLGLAGQIQTAFYDLRAGKLVPETPEILQGKQERLEALLGDLDREVDFEKTPFRQNCQFCPYTDMCGIE